MKNKLTSINLSRRDFLKIAGGAAAITAGASMMPNYLRKVLLPEQAVEAQTGYDLYYAGTDGWIYLPPTPAIFLPGTQTAIHPDRWARLRLIPISLVSATYLA